MSDNGKDLNKETPEQKEIGAGDDKPKVAIQVIMYPDGKFEMKSSLGTPMVIWIMEQIKFSLMSKTTEQSNRIIQLPKGGIMNFVRKTFRR